MRIRIKDPSGIIKSYHTERLETIRRGVLEVISNEIGSKTFQIQVQDYGCGWSEWTTVNLNVIENEVLEAPSLQETLPELELGQKVVLNFNNNNEKILENSINENDLGVEFTNSQLILNAYTQGTYNLSVKNYKTYENIDELNKNSENEKSGTQYSSALDIPVIVKGPEGCQLQTIDFEVDSNTITLSEASIKQKLGDYNIHSIYLRQLVVSSKPQDGGTYTQNPQTEAEIIHNNGFLCKFYNNDTFVKEILCLNTSETLNFKGNEFQINFDDVFEVKSGNSNSTDITKIISLKLYCYIY